MAKNKNWEETEWTICFHLPTGDVFPNKCNDFQKELDNNVLTWDNKDEAKEFAKSKAANNTWDLFATKITVITT